MPSNPTPPTHPPSATSTAASTRDTLSIVQSGVEELLLTDGVLEPEPSPQPPTLPSSLTPAPVTVVRTPSPLANQSLQASALPEQHPMTSQHMNDSVVGQSSATGYPLTNTQPPAGTTHLGQLQYSTPGAQYTTPLTTASQTVMVSSQASLPPPSLPSAPVGVPGVNQNPATFQHSPAVSMPHYPNPAAVSIPFTSTTSGQTPPLAGAAQGVSFTPSLSSEVPVSHTASGLPTLPPTISLPTVAPKISFGPSPFLPAATTS